MEGSAHFCPHEVQGSGVPHRYHEPTMGTSAVDPSAAPSAIADPAPEPLSMAAVLRIPAMRRLWYAQLVSVFGDFLALFAVIGVLTFNLHASAPQIIGIQIAYLLPIAILGVLAGVFVDRWPLKPTMISSDAIRCGLVLLLLPATQLWQFYAVLAAISVVSSFFGPAQGVALRSIVPLHGLRSANALMQQVMMGMRIIGPALAALLVASFGPRSCYLADAASFAASACLLATVALTPSAPQTPQTPAQNTSPLARILSEMKGGFSFIVHHAALLFVILALGTAMFVLGCFGPLIAVYVRDSVHASTRVFGLASAGIGAGMFVGINLLTIAGKRLSNNVLVYAGLAGIGVGLVVLTTLTHIWSTMLGTLLIGFAVAGIIIPAQTLIQQETPPALMGRVGSTVMSVIFSAQIAGLILSSLLSGRIGVRAIFAVCAVLLTALIAAGRLWMEPKPTGRTPSEVPST